MIKEIRKNQFVEITANGVMTKENNQLSEKLFETKKHFNYAGNYYENNIHGWNSIGLKEQALPQRNTIVKTPYS